MSWRPGARRAFTSIIELAGHPISRLLHVCCICLSCARNFARACLRACVHVCMCACVHACMCARIGASIRAWCGACCFVLRVALRVLVAAPMAAAAGGRGVSSSGGGSSSYDASRSLSCMRHCDSYWILIAAAATTAVAATNPAAGCSDGNPGPDNDHVQSWHNPP